MRTLQVSPEHERQLHAVDCRRLSGLSAFAAGAARQFALVRAEHPPVRTGRIRDLRRSSRRSNSLPSTTGSCARVSASCSGDSKGPLPLDYSRA
jgi:hypothetical protein